MVIRNFLRLGHALDAGRYLVLLGFLVSCGGGGNASGGGAGTGTASSGTAGASGTPGNPQGGNNSVAGSANGSAGASSLPQDPEAPVAIQQFIDLFITASCVNTIGCFSGGNDALGEIFFFASQSECESWYRFQLEPHLALMVAGVDEGKLQFSSQEAAHCIAGIPHQCMLYDPTKPLAAFQGPCAEVFEGQLAEDEQCMDDLECAASAFCESTQELISCFGRCRLRIVPGGPCVPNVTQCSADEGIGAYCDAVQGDCVLVTGTKIAQVDQPCGPALARTNGDQVACSSDAWCDLQSDGTGVCRSLLAAGEECTDAQPCIAGHICVPDVTETCQEVTVVRQAGLPCSNDDLQVCYSSLDPIECGAEGVCEPFPLAPEGQPCGLMQRCELGLHCDTMTDTCSSPSAEGEQCFEDDDCESRNCSPNGRCSPRYCESSYP